MSSTDSAQKVLEQPSLLLKDEIDQVAQWYQVVIDYLTNYSFQLIGAFIIFVIGYYFAGKVSKWVLNLCQRQNLDITLSQFLSNTSKMLMVILITIVALGKLGISVTPFIAAIGAISLGAGLALQGLLANYAAGFNIIIIRPFVVGDTITVQGVTGVVKEVLLAYTVIVDKDNVDITIPNKHIVGEVLHNSKHDSLLELNVGIAYKHNPLEVIELIKAAIIKLDIVGEQKALQVGIDEFSDNAITIEVRLWTPTISLFDNKYKAYEAIYLALQQANIEIPFPQRTLHLATNLSEAKIVNNG
ncbi:mechanosensitive ion channel family protein [Litorilituus lipolyticus]|uniref:Small-conductance mechanosensitive channel n=1 Tax=Litorilituus lipolyticus TaxID=2491017 RepID=A0A502KXN0_9GAMM|nr:mechanosensitive ion channel family protein [Litorilituus lipolyticus]TPH15219.1 mechanosensitive ion channel family protein [Litorilituus lipolyticus]